MKTLFHLTLLGMLSLSCSFVGSAHATSLPEMQRQLQRDLSLSDDAVYSCPIEADASPMGEAPDSAYFFRRFWLRVKPKVAFKIPGFAKLEVSPEIEMLWQRELPEGWTGYKPVNLSKSEAH